LKKCNTDICSAKKEGAVLSIAPSFLNIKLGYLRPDHKKTGYTAGFYKDNINNTCLIKIRKRDGFPHTIGQVTDQ